MDNKSRQEAIKWLETAYKPADQVLDGLLKRWGVDNYQIIHKKTYNMVIRGNSELYGPVIIKFHRRENEFIHELDGLKSFTTETSCQLFDSNAQYLVLIEEALIPGEELVTEKDIDKRLQAFCNLFNKLHNPKSTYQVSEVDLLKRDSYKQWVIRITAYMKEQEEWSALSQHMTASKNLLFDLLNEYPEITLLHGDFHYYNILKSGESYKFIDPKGVIGHPIFDIPRYILNEYWDEKDELKKDCVVEYVVDVISTQLMVPKATLYQLLYIEGCMANCWNVQDGMPLSQQREALASLDYLASKLYLTL